MTRDEDALRELLGQLAEREPGAGTDGAWLRDRLRRRRMRHAGAAVVATAAVAVGAVSLTALTPEREPNGQVALTPPTPSTEPTETATASAMPAPLPVPPPLRERTGTRLLIVQGTTLSVFDVDAQTSTPLPTDPRLADHDRIDVLAVEDELVLMGNDSTGAGQGVRSAYATTDGPGSPLREIGEGTYLIPSATPGRVWLETVEEAEQSRTTLVEVDLTGTVHRQAVLENTFGATPFANGFLRQDMTTDEVQLVDEAGRVLRTYPGTRFAAVSGGTAILVDRECVDTCRLHLVSADADVPPRTVQVDGRAAMGLHDVTLLGDQLLIGVPRTDDDDALHVLRADRGGAMTRVPQVTADRYWGFRPAVSADARWMFWVDGDDRTVDAYDVASGTAYRTTPAATMDITSVVALP